MTLLKLVKPNLIQHKDYFFLKLKNSKLFLNLILYYIM